MTLYLKNIKKFWKSPVEDMTNDTKAINILKRHKIDNMEQLYEVMENNTIGELKGMGGVRLKTIKSAFVEHYLNFLDEDEIVEFFRRGITPSEALDVITSEMEKKDNLECRRMGLCDVCIEKGCEGDIYG